MQAKHAKTLGALIGRIGFNCFLGGGVEGGYYSKKHYKGTIREYYWELFRPLHDSCGAPPSLCRAGPSVCAGHANCARPWPHGATPQVW